MMNAADKAVARAVQGDIPLATRPFAAIADALGVTEEDVLATLARWKGEGILRKFSAIVRHREVGYTANAMVVWAVPPERRDEAGKAFAAHPAVSHCYERTPPFDGRFTLFTMVHLKEKDEAPIRALADAAGISEYRILWTDEEFKKISMTYFGE